MPVSGTKRQRAQSSDETHQEIHVKSEWGTLLDRHQVLTARRVGSHNIWLVDELLSIKECARLLSRAEAYGFGTTHYEPSYRGNLRLTTIDASLARVVWERIRALVPRTITLRKPDDEAEKAALWWDHYPHAEGEWEAYGLNECWRLAKYRAGDRFLCHCDEAYVGSSPQEGRLDAVAEMSMLSVNIYMNGGFDNGRTRFFLRDDWRQQLKLIQDASGEMRYHAKEHGAEPDLSVVPTVGQCLLFQQPPGQCYYHDGEELGSGCKYLFRSDVMYRRKRLPACLT
uniref:Prolyl 4-hydroxylase alpha subunit domain-containing protein n=1 Tax=Haptolina ericina TaxID=156174 RepID=A0A7S3C1Q9_9EUKA|mmetsp:Transcript_73682/g.163761  ORF Transcript_73682/g.163761 Transcript_73682/m.163761 type:complete len:284 (+) Transcript_73682:53-904(+)